MGTFRAVLTNSASPPSPSQLLSHDWCTSGGEPMYNRDDEHKLFPKSFDKQCECSVLAAGKEGVAAGSE